MRMTCERKWESFSRIRGPLRLSCCQPEDSSLSHPSTVSVPQQSIGQNIGSSGHLNQGMCRQETGLKFMLKLGSRLWLRLVRVVKFWTRCT